MLDCYWKYYFGIECPGCGFQRSCWALFQGDLFESLRLFPATIPFLLTLLILILHLRFKFNQGAKLIIITFSSTTAIIVISFIVKIMNHGVHG